MKKTLIFLFTFLSVLSSSPINQYINQKSCDQIIDKKLYHICYSYEYKGAIAGWVELDGELVAKNKIRKRPRFYSEQQIPLSHRSYYKDYTGVASQWNRGHFIVADADFDYDHKALKQAYSMANIIPQSATLNQKTWIKVEKYGRELAQKYGHITSISIAKYPKNPQTIKNNIAIPSKLYRIYINQEAKFEKCFEYDNELDIDYKNDKLKNHEIECPIIQIK